MYGVYIAVKDSEGGKRSSYLSQKHFRCFLVFEFFQVKFDARALREIQLEPNGCKHEVRIAANVGTWK